MKDGSAPKLVRVNFAAKLRRKVGLMLLNSSADAVDMDKELAGYALVTWDHRGAAQCCWWSKDGPIATSLIPAFIADAISRRIASDAAVDEIHGVKPDYDDPA